MLPECVWGMNGLPVDSVADSIAAVTGEKYSRDELFEIGERTASLCQAFNAREGIRPADFKLPAILAGEPPATEGPHANVTVPVAAMARDFFTAMEWDYETGKPSERRLKELGMGDVAEVQEAG